MKETTVLSRVLASAAVIVALFFILNALRGALRERQMRLTLSRSAKIVVALDQYHRRFGEYPVSPEARVDQIATSLSSVGGPSTEAEASDGWGRSFYYLASGTDYVLWSMGDNGKVDRLPGGGEYDDYRYDFIVVSGTIWQAPAGHY